MFQVVGFLDNCRQPQQPGKIQQTNLQGGRDMRSKVLGQIGIQI